MTVGVIGIELVIVWFLRKLFVDNLMRGLITLFKSKREAVWLYSLLTLPGLLVHEIAHFLTAAGLGLRTGKIELLPVLSDAGGVELGSVQVEKADPIRLTLVGLAPLLTGLPLVAWLSLQMPKNYLGWGYLIICVTIHLLPSKKDMRYWPVTLIIVGLLLWSGYQIKNNYLLESIRQGLLVPLEVLAGSTSLMFLINWFISKRRIVQ